MTSERCESQCTIPLRLRSFSADLVLPPGTDILRVRDPGVLADVPAAVRDALSAPLGSAPFARICREKVARSAKPSVVVVVSDNTRPAPYRGPGGILWPLVETLLGEGFLPGSITVLVATGTHRVLDDFEMRAMLDERVSRAGVRLRCHDAGDRSALVGVGHTGHGVEVSMNRDYLEADFRILTGVVEPHFMAGASGGRKSVCPGLLDVESVRDFHGPKVLADDRVADLVLEGNPCHELSLEIARMARPDFILNATVRQDGGTAGVFAGEMERAHLAAVDHLRSFSQLPLECLYDIVVTHGGLVGVNHYQAAKAALAAARAVREGGRLIVVADTTDPDPVGTEPYRRMLALLAEVGPEQFIRLIQSDDWRFVHDQWEAQMWAKLPARVPSGNFFYFSPQTPLRDYAILQCADPTPLLSDVRGIGAGEGAAAFVRAALARAGKESEAALGRSPSVAYLADGPHCVPVERLTDGR
ncbi:MAG: lactate racemase domain-containing protein [bacterium]